MLVKLEGLDFFAHHGVYAEEREIGNKYTVTIEIEINDDINFLSDDLNNTINYEEVYQLVKEVMDQPKMLLETLAAEINKKALDRFANANKVTTIVSKHNPPIKGVCLKATIEYSQSRT